MDDKVVAPVVVNIDLLPDPHKQQAQQLAKSSLRSARKKTTVEGVEEMKVEAGDDRGVVIAKLLFNEAKRKGREHPSNFDVTVDIAGKVININKPNGLGAPSLKTAGHAVLLVHYSAMLTQVEAWLESTLMAHQAIPAPTLCLMDKIAPSWWWCRPTDAFKNLIKSRYHGLPTVNHLAKWYSYVVEPTALNRARLDPFFAVW